MFLDLPMSRQRVISLGGKEGVGETFLILSWELFLFKLQTFLTAVLCFVRGRGEDVVGAGMQWPLDTFWRGIQEAARRGSLRAGGLHQGSYGQGSYSPSRAETISGLAGLLVGD